MCGGARGIRIKESPLLFLRYRLASVNFIHFEFSQNSLFLEVEFCVESNFGFSKINDQCYCSVINCSVLVAFVLFSFVCRC